MSNSKQVNDAASIKCDECDSYFNEKKDVQLHGFYKHGKKLVRCEHCGEFFTKLQNMKRHQRTSCVYKNDIQAKRVRREESDSSSDNENEVIEKRKISCKDCNATFCRPDGLKRHIAKYCKKQNVSKVLHDAASNLNIQKNEVAASQAVASTSNTPTPTCSKGTEKHPSPNMESRVESKEGSTSPSTENSAQSSEQQTADSDMETDEGSTSSGEMIGDSEFVKMLESGEIASIESGFKSRICTYNVKNKSNINDPMKYLNKKSSLIKYVIQKELQSKQCLKVNVRFEVEHEKLKGETQEKNFKTVNVPIYRESDLNEFVSKTYDKLQREMSEFQGKGSGWQVSKVLGLEIRINNFNPLRGNGYIDLPVSIRMRNAVVNIQNNDSHCFKYSVLAKFVSVTYPEHYDYSKLGHKYNFHCVSAPTKLSEIPRFEKLNNMSINVFGLDESEKIFPLKVCDVELPDHRDLLFLTDQHGSTHFCYISNFEKLVGSQLSKKKCRKNICKRCFKFYNTDNNGEERLREHKRLCNKRKVARIEMPDSEHSEIKFKNVENSLRLPIAVYADFESILKKVDTCMPDPTHSSTTPTQMHELLSYCVYVKTFGLNDAETRYLPKEPYVYRKTSESEDVGTHFMKYIQKLANIVKEIYAKKDPMNPLTDVEKESYANAKECYLCKNVFTSSNYKVRDHDHLTGKFRGACHRICNLNNRKPRVLPIFFHGLSNYDSHFIVKSLGTVPGNVEVIPNTEETYISFTKKIGNISCRFLDSFRFMSCSLSTLANNLPREAFHETVKHSSTLSDEQLNLLVRKGVYCYDYTDSLEKLKETSLPPKDKFCSLLTESEISDGDYEHAQTVWNQFNIRTLGEYSDLYLKTDVLILADVFERFRTLCLTNYLLDPCYYFTAPGLAWDAALKKSKVEIELLQDYDMILMIEEGIRGGFTTCVTRHAVANNRHLNYFDPSKPEMYIFYGDANNLYGGSMISYLPYGGFEWADVNNLGPIEDMKDDDDVGYIFEVDVSYPDDLHDVHSDLPFLPHRSVPIGSSYPKLLATLHNKEKYVVHYSLLKQAIANGLIVTKIHRALKFKQKPWLAEYINDNTNHRKAAKNQFERDFFKLMNNAVFGKTMEQVRKRLNVRIVVNEIQLQKLINKNNFLDRTIYSENVALVFLAKESIVMNKPIFVGQAILDISKITMYSFYYDVLKARYKEKIKLLYGDTDAWIYMVETPDVYDDCLEMKEHFDFSDYPKDHKCHSLENMKVLCKFKDETNSKPISQFCGLRPKMYFIEVNGEDIIKKIKGVKSYAVKNKICMADYLKCLQTKDSSLVSYRNIMSKKHNVFTFDCTKVALSFYDDKRVILNDGINTLPYGHKKIRDVEMDVE